MPISNRYVFAKVMRDNPRLCARLVETALGVEVGRAEAFEVESEATSVENKSICIDVFVESDSAVFSVEMQAYDEDSLPLRMRYYRSLVDRRILPRGADYSRLKPVYIVFLCVRDPFGLGLPVYTFTSRCEQDERMPFYDGAVSVALNASGDLSLVPAPLADLLQYIKTGKPGADQLSAALQGAVKEAFDDERWANSVITIEQDIRDAERAAARKARAAGEAEGHAAGIAEGMSAGVAQGRTEGHAEERGRMAALAAAMAASGSSIEEMLDALTDGTIERLYDRFGIR